MLGNSICLTMFITNMCYLCAGAILEVVSFHDRIARTGLAPSQTLPQMMCAEFYKCGGDGESEINATKTDL